MLLSTLVLLAPLVIGKRLTDKENRKLQDICGQPNEMLGSNVWELTKKSLDSTDAEPERTPWVASISYGGDLCSGSLISSRHVLTAAHCIERLVNRSCTRPTHKVLKKIEKISITIGSSCHSKKICNSAGLIFRYQHLRRGQAVFLPKYFNCGRDSLLTDIAVIELNKDVPFDERVYPACLSVETAAVGQQLAMYGYGLDPAEVDEETEEIRSGILTTIETEVVKCPRRIGSSKYNFCVNIQENAPCSGDSGAAMVYQDFEDRTVIAGVHVEGTSCSELLMIPKNRRHEDSTIYKASVRISPYLNWICRWTGVCAVRK